MKGKVLGFFCATLVLLGIVFGMYMRYIYVGSYGVFIESYDHGVLTVDSDNTVGDDKKFRVMVKKGDEITININPERTDDTYYVLNKLTVNGKNVTDEVNMLQYKAVVDSKLTVVATFKKGKRPEASDKKTESVKASSPKIEKVAADSYIGSYGAYDVKDPGVFYDKASGYYYCFGSDNVVVRSKDLLNWSLRTTYFEHPENAASNAIMTFSQFESVKKWAKDHGYGKTETSSDKNNDRTPLAPEVIKVDDTYYMYFSLSKINSSNESAIFCVKTDNLSDSIDTKNWEDVGLVISSCAGDKANAVHPSVLYNDGKMYMVYGGYYNRNGIDGEINLVELDPTTGLLKKDSSINSGGESISGTHGKNTFRSGAVVADPGAVPALSSGEGSLVSGADLVYNKDTGFYYLFVTYGNEGTNYNVRVARSRNVEGPYTDYNGQAMDDFSKDMYAKGHLLLGGYNFTNSSDGRVSYTNVGRASIGSPKVIKDSEGNWFVASQSQLYYKVDSSIMTGSLMAEENGISTNSAPCLEVREMYWNEQGWPVAMPEVYSGATAKTNVKLTQLYGNWDIVVFDAEGDKNDYKAVERNQSQIVSIFQKAVISQKDINKNTDINVGLSFSKAGDAYTVTIDGVQYTVYVASLWDWELQQGSIVLTGMGDDGSTIWGKKNLSTSVGLYTDAFYYLYGKCEGTVASEVEKRLEKMKNNPSQSLIDKHINWMLDNLTVNG